MPGSRPHSLARRLLTGASVGLTLAGCGPFEEEWPRGLPCEPPASVHLGDDGPAHFDPSRMLCVQIGMAASDLQAMREDQRFEGPPFGMALAWSSQCDSGKPGGYTWFEAELRLDGVLLERVGIRKKGFVGSLSTVKPSLKIDTDREVEGQKLGPRERLTFNNSRQDPARFSVCLAYEVFARAGVRAPRCNLANVVLAGEALGAYAHVEPMDKRFLARAFGDASGDFYEGTVADVAPGYLPEDSDGIGHFEAQTGSTDPDGAALRAVVAALQADDATLLEVLGKHVNVQRFHRYWAVEVLVGHTDSYSAGRNNFLVYFDPGDAGRASWVPWGADAVFTDGTGKDDPNALANFLSAELPRRLSRLPEMRQAMAEALQDVLDGSWDEDDLVARLEGFAAQVRTAQDDPAYDAELSRLRTWIRGRRATVQAWIDRGVPAGAAEPTACGEVLGPFWAGALFKDLAFGL